MTVNVYIHTYIREARGMVCVANNDRPRHSFSEEMKAKTNWIVHKAQFEKVHNEEKLRKK